MCLICVLCVLRYLHLTVWCGIQDFYGQGIIVFILIVILF